MIDLKARVGPLPVWGWGIVGVVGGAGGLLWLRRARAKSTGTGGGGLSLTPAAQAYDSGSGGGGGFGGGGSGSGSPSTTPIVSGGTYVPPLLDAPVPAPATNAPTTNNPGPFHILPVVDQGRLSQPTGDPVHDAAIQNPDVSRYLQSLYESQQGAMSKPTGDATHDAAIQDPAVSRYLQSLYLAGSNK